MMQIVNFGEMVDVAQRRITHQLLIRTADGQQHSVTTDERTVQQLLQILTGGGGEERPVGTEVMADSPYPLPPSTGELSGVELRRNDPEEDDLAEIFGGDVDPGEQAPEPVMGVIAEDRVADVPDEPRGLGARRAPPEERPPAPRPVRVDADGFALPIPSRTVPKDEMGYPIVTKNKNVPVLPDDGGDDGTQI